MNLERKPLRKKPDITYLNLLLLSLCIAGIVFFFQQILLDLNIPTPRFKAGNFDLYKIVGLFLSIFAAYITFNRTIKEESKQEEDTKYTYVLRELDQLSEEVREIEKRMGEIEKAAHANKLLFDHHERELFHIGAQKKLAILESELVTLKITLNIISRDNEYALRIARLEEEIEDIGDHQN